MNTKIYPDYQAFLARANSEENGVSKAFAAKNPDWEEQNKSNKGCWDCSRCSDCSDCSDCSCCKDIPTESKYACLPGVYKYVTSPRIHPDGSQHIQMGCHLRPRSEWEDDFWNNNKEFPNNGDQASKDRWFAFQIACQWLDYHAGPKVS